MVAEFNSDLADMLGVFRLAEPDVLLDDGDALDLPGRRVRVVWTPGHTPGHICLYDADHGVLLTGDHLLPRISPNIGLTPGSMDSPLASYLNRCARWPTTTAPRRCQPMSTGSAGSLGERAP